MGSDRRLIRERTKISTILDAEFFESCAGVSPPIVSERARGNAGRRLPAAYGAISDFTLVFSRCDFRPRAVLGPSAGALYPRHRLLWQRGVWKLRAASHGGRGQSFGAVATAEAGATELIGGPLSHWRRGGGGRSVLNRNARVSVTFESVPYVSPDAAAYVCEKRGGRASDLLPPR